ncbi:hypothetical protein B0H17DRAFT_1095027 [Mycena rosella]|uniref:Uncharacterized protein n=1 Tax=Mycena rosella TaxID=1033263 RepID=A0AAD7CT32_MYCRO|nr:hypothetical protein B0H17DRAFT_1095027 [Mycena rosella]
MPGPAYRAHGDETDGVLDRLPFLAPCPRAPYPRILSPPSFCHIPRAPYTTYPSCAVQSPFGSLAPSLHILSLPVSLPLSPPLRLPPPAIPSSHPSSRFSPFLPAPFRPFLAPNCGCIERCRRVNVVAPRACCARRRREWRTSGASVTSPAPATRTSRMRRRCTTADSDAGRCATPVWLPFPLRSTPHLPLPLSLLSFRHCPPLSCCGASGADVHAHHSAVALPPHPYRYPPLLPLPAPILPFSFLSCAPVPYPSLFSRL